MALASAPLGAINCFLKNLLSSLRDVAIRFHPCVEQRQTRSNSMSSAATSPSTCSTESTMSPPCVAAYASPSVAGDAVLSAEIAGGLSGVSPDHDGDCTCASDSDHAHTPGRDGAPSKHRPHHSRHCGASPLDIHAVGVPDSPTGHAAGVQVGSHAGRRLDLWSVVSGICSRPPIRLSPAGTSANYVSKHSGLLPGAVTGRAT